MSYGTPEAYFGYRGEKPKPPPQSRLERFVVRCGCGSIGVVAVVAGGEEGTQVHLYCTVCGANEPIKTKG